MIKKLVLFLMSVAVLFTLFVGCGEDKNLDGTTGNDTTNITQNETEDVFLDIEEETTLPNIDTLTFPQYNAMSAENQQAVVNSFETVDEFLNWYNDAKQEHEEFQDKVMNSGSSETSTEISDGNETVTTSPVVSNPEAEGMTFMKYHEMSGADQKAFINTFDSIEAFVAWHSAARQEYLDSMTEIDGSTPIDLDATKSEN